MSQHYLSSLDVVKLLSTSSVALCMTLDRRWQVSRGKSNCADHCAADNSTWATADVSTHHFYVDLLEILFYLLCSMAIIGMHYKAPKY